MKQFLFAVLVLVFVSACKKEESNENGIWEYSFYSTDSYQDSEYVKVDSTLVYYYLEISDGTITSCFTNGFFNYSCDKTEGNNYSCVFDNSDLPDYWNFTKTVEYKGNKLLVTIDDGSEEEIIEFSKSSLTSLPCE